VHREVVKQRGRTAELLQPSVSTCACSNGATQSLFRKGSARQCNMDLLSVTKVTRDIDDAPPADMLQNSKWLTYAYLYLQQAAV